MPTKVIKPEDILLDRRQRAEDDFYWFCREIVGYKDLYEPLHRKVCHFLTRWKKAKPTKVLLIPRRHLKSSIASIALPLWLWIKDKETRILLVHGKRGSAVEYLGEIKKNLIYNEKLKEIAPDCFYSRPEKEADRWVQDRITIKVDKGHSAKHKKVPSMMASGTEASSVGFHFNFIILDDIVYEENVRSSELRAKTLKFFHDCQAMLLPGGHMVMVGTRWHWDDVYSQVINATSSYKEVIDHMVMDCGYEKGEPTFPLSESGSAGFTMEMLTRLKVSMRDQFWCHYMNDPRVGDQGLFQRENIQFFSLSSDGHPPSKPIQYFSAVDPNRSENTKGDPCAVITAGMDAEGHIWVVDLSHGHPTGIELVQWIRAHVERWNPVCVYVETQNYQLQLCNWLREDMLRSRTPYRIREVVRGATTRKYDRITAMQPLVEAKGLHVRKGLDVIVTELEHFPNWKHDDTIDALADIYKNAYRPNTPVEKRVTINNPFLLKNIMEEALPGQAPNWR